MRLRESAKVTAKPTRATVPLPAYEAQRDDSFPGPGAFKVSSRSGHRDFEQDLPAGGALAPRRPCAGAGPSAVSVPRGTAGGAAATAPTTRLGSSALLLPYAPRSLGLRPSAVPAQRTSAWDTGRSLLASEDAGAVVAGRHLVGFTKVSGPGKTVEGWGGPL